ncbi:hypothetical protein Tco_0264994, partial [Tanacetum coccineum]
YEAILPSSGATVFAYDMRYCQGFGVMSSMRMLKNVDPRIAINMDPNTPRNDTYKERYVPNEQNVMDLEDFGSNVKSPGVGPRLIVRSFETNVRQVV